MKIHSNKRGTMRIYTIERINKMSVHERQNAIDAVKTSNTLTPQEKEANLKLLEEHDRTKAVLQQINESAADIGDIHG